MKAPDTIHTYGDLRMDGYRFVNYEKTRYGIQEKWASPESWARIKAYQQRYQKAYKAKRRELNAAARAAKRKATT